MVGVVGKKVWVGPEMKKIGGVAHRLIFHDVVEIVEMKIGGEAAVVSYSDNEQRYGDAYKLPFSVNRFLSLHGRLYSFAGFIMR